MKLLGSVREAGRVGGVMGKRGKRGRLSQLMDSSNYFWRQREIYMKQIKVLSEENLSEILVISLCSSSNDLTSIFSRSRLIKMKHVFVFGSVKLLNDFSWRFC